MRRHVKGGVVDRHTVGGNRNPIDVRDLFAAALLDRDLIPVGQGQVHRAGRHHCIDRNPVLARHNRQLVGPNLVGDIPIGCNPVSPEEHSVHLTGAHQVASAVVSDQMHRDASPQQFPRGQPGPLQARSGLIDPDMDALALFGTGVDHTQRSAKVDRGERPRVAVVQQIGAVGDQVGPIKPHAPVDGHIFFGDGVCFVQQKPLQHSNRWVSRLLGGVQHARRGPAEVDRSRPCIVQQSLGPAQIRKQPGGVVRRAGVRSQHHGIRARRSDRRSPPHHHRLDRLSDRCDSRIAVHRKCTRQPPLIDQHDLPVFPKDCPYRLVCHGTHPTTKNASPFVQEGA